MVSGKRKEELVAVAYASNALNLPCVITKAEESEAVKDDYGELLIVDVDNVQLPDPLKDLQDWIGEVDGVRNWPPCMYANIAAYLLEKEQKDLLNRLIGDYKEGVLSYFWLSNYHVNMIIFIVVQYLFKRNYL